MFHFEGTASAKALRQDRAWCVGETVSPVWLLLSEGGGKREEVRAGR